MQQKLVKHQVLKILVALGYVQWVPKWDLLQQTTQPVDIAISLVDALNCGAYSEPQNSQISTPFTDAYLNLSRLYIHFISIKFKFK